jgi:enediyne polyketide synthase
VFTNPVIITEPSTRIRVAALVRSDRRVDVALRTSATGFQRDHFRATCHITPTDALRSSVLSNRDDHGSVDLDPARDLYGDLLFHGARFRRLKGYRALKASGCTAEVGPADPSPWFGGYMPESLTLGDPAARDAALHAVQACIPHATVLPVAVESIELGVLSSNEEYVVSAIQRTQDSSSFVYDIEIHTSAGELRERWRGARLNRVAMHRPTHAWNAALLKNYLERRVGDLFNLPLAIAVTPAVGEARSQRSQNSISQLLGADAHVTYRTDGKPEFHGASPKSVSVAHVAALTIAVAADKTAACDIELVLPRSPETWQAMLGPDGWQLSNLIREQTHTDIGTASTLTWCGRECMKKAGAGLATPLLLGHVTDDGWVVLEASDYRIAALSTRVRDVTAPVVMAFLLQQQSPPA